MISDVREVTSENVNIAYSVSGDGSHHLVLVPGFVSNLELDTEGPEYALFLQRLGFFCRVIRQDKRGTGLSYRGVGLPSLEVCIDDARAVLGRHRGRVASLCRAVAVKSG